MRAVKLVLASKKGDILRGHNVKEHYSYCGIKLQALMLNSFEILALRLFQSLCFSIHELAYTLTDL